MNSVADYIMYLDVKAMAGLLEVFTKLFCVEFYDGKVFVLRTVMLVIVACLCTIDIVPVLSLVSRLLTKAVSLQNLMPLMSSPLWPFYCIVVRYPSSFTVSLDV